MKTETWPKWDLNASVAAKCIMGSIKFPSSIFAKKSCYSIPAIMCRWLKCKRRKAYFYIYELLMSVWKEYVHLSSINKCFISHDSLAFILVELRILVSSAFCHWLWQQNYKLMHRSPPPPSLQPYGVALCIFSLAVESLKVSVWFLLLSLQD